MVGELVVNSHKILHVPFYLDKVFCLFSRKFINNALFCEICSSCIEDNGYLYLSSKWKKIISAGLGDKSKLEGMGIDSYFWQTKSRDGVEARPFVTLHKDRPGCIDVIGLCCLQKVVDGLGYVMEPQGEVDFGISYKLAIKKD